jgi:hypothetical protein
MHDIDKPHTHTHEHERPPLVKILGFLRAHNEEHADETAGIADQLAQSGHAAEADIIREGLALIRAGNAKVAEALAALEAAEEE